MQFWSPANKFACAQLCMLLLLSGRSVHQSTDPSASRTIRCFTAHVCGLMGVPPIPTCSSGLRQINLPAPSSACCWCTELVTQKCRRTLSTVSVPRRSASSRPILPVVPHFRQSYEHLHHNIVFTKNQLFFTTADICTDTPGSPAFAPSPTDRRCSFWE